MAQDREPLCGAPSLPPSSARSADADGAADGMADADAAPVGDGAAAEAMADADADPVGDARIVG